jgi:recombination protein RecT
MSNAMTVVEDKVFDCEARFNAVNKYKIGFKREANFALQLLKNSDYLLSTAQKNPDSLQNAISNLAAIGISLNPATKESYLVPRGGAVCLDISAIGLIKLATDSGSILWGQAKLVYEKDTYENRGVSAEPLHRSNTFGDRGAVIGGYVIAKTHNGDFLIEEMSIKDCHDIRDRSEAWKAFKSGKTKSCPWASDEGEMIKKTIVKRASKYWPKSERVNEAIHMLNEYEGIDFNKERQGAFANTPSETAQEAGAIEKVRELLKVNNKTEEALLKYLNNKFKTEMSTIEELMPIHIEEALRAMGGAK